jgi:hypothetical protein
VSSKGDGPSGLNVRPLVAPLAELPLPLLPPRLLPLLPVGLEVAAFVGRGVLLGATVRSSLSRIRASAPEAASSTKTARANCRAYSGQRSSLSL